MSAGDAARAFLATVAQGDGVTIGALEAFANAALDASPVARLALRVLDEQEPCRLARALELAGLVLDGARRKPCIAAQFVETDGVL